MSIFETIIVILLLVLVLAVVWMITEFATVKKQLEDIPPKIDPEVRRLRLQAYERMAVLVERIALPNILSRVSPEGALRQMQMTINGEIKQEYEYNLSQQIYIEPEIWRAVTGLKEQNIYIVNQIADTLPPQATALDLSKKIVDFIIHQDKASLHTRVLEVINEDAKKLM